MGSFNDEIEASEKLLKGIEAKYGIGKNEGELDRVSKRLKAEEELLKGERQQRVGNSWVQNSLKFRRSTWGDLKRMTGPVQWDWEGWLPRGFVTVLAAEPGMGKSLLCLRVVSCFLSGLSWPDGRPFVGRRGRVIWCEGEGSQSLNVERANELGLELDNIYTPLPNPLTAFRMDDDEHMQALMHFCRDPEVRLVVMDSLSSLVVGGPTPSGRPSLTVRGIPRGMYSLGEIARVTRTSILVTHHLRKRTTLDGDGLVDLQRLRGTSKIGQMARVVWTLDAPNVLDRENKRLAVVKNNLILPPGSLGMRIEKWGLVFGEAPVAVVDEGVSKLEGAAAFLLDLLGEGVAPFSEVLAAGEAEGFSEKTLRRAKKVLGVKSKRMMGRKEWGWYVDNK